MVVAKNNIITYTASSKLAEITTTSPTPGLHTKAFSGTNGRLAIVSHTFENRVGTIEFNDDVTSIGQFAFYQCDSLTSIEIPNSVISIGSDAFASCTSLTSINIPSSVTSIGSGAFESCGLTNVTIGSGVTTIGQSAFYNCRNLKSITSLAITAPSITNATFRNVNTGGTLTVPIGSSGYNVWMGTGNYYLGRYNWTKEEQ